MVVTSASSPRGSNRFRLAPLSLQVPAAGASDQRGVVASAASSCVLLLYLPMSAAPVVSEMPAWSPASQVSLRGISRFVTRSLIISMRFQNIQKSFDNYTREKYNFQVCPNIIYWP